MSQQPPTTPRLLPVFEQELRRLCSVMGMQMLAIQWLGITIVASIFSGLYFAGMQGLAKISITGDSLVYALNTPNNSFTLFMLFFGFSLGGRFTAQGTGSTAHSAGQLDIAVAATSLTACVGIVLVYWLITRKLFKKKKTTTWQAAAFSAILHATVLSLIFSVICLPWKAEYSLGGQFQGSIELEVAAVFLTVWCLTSIAHFCALLPPNSSAAMGIIRTLREVLSFSLVFLGAYSAVILLLGTVAPIDELPKWALLGILPILGSISAYAVSLSFFGALGSGTTGLDSLRNTGFLPSDFNSIEFLRITDIPGGLGILCSLANIVIIVILALHIGVRRPRTTKAGIASRIWQLPLFTVLFWAGLTSLASIRMNITLSGFDGQDASGSFSVQAAWYSSLCIASGAAIVSLLAEVLPKALHRVSPGLLTFFAGKTATHNWLSQTEAKIGPIDYLPSMQASSTTSSSLPPAAKKSLSRKNKTLVFTAVTAAVVFCAGAIIVSTVNSQRNPETVVESYMTLLAEGKAEQASKMVNPGIDPKDQILLTDNVFATSTQRLEIDSIRNIGETPDGSPIISALYLINDQKFQKNFVVTRGSKDYGLFNTWKLEDPLLIPITIASKDYSIWSPHITEAQIGGVEFALSKNELGYSRELYVYPGVYQVKAITDDLVDAQPKDLLAGDPDSTDTYGTIVNSAELIPEPTAALDQLILDRVQKVAESCTKIPTNLKSLCPEPLRSKNLQSASIVEAAKEVVHAEAMVSFGTSDYTFKYKLKGHPEKEFKIPFEGSLQWTDDNLRTEVTGARNWR